MEKHQDLFAEFGISESDLHHLLIQNKKLEAVKLIKERTGWGLKESKDFVDDLTTSSGNKPSYSPKGELAVNSEGIDNFISQATRDEVLQLINQDRKMEAVKFVCDHSDLGLFDAKNLVESMQAGHVEFSINPGTNSQNTNVEMTNNNGEIQCASSSTSNQFSDHTF